MVSFERRAWVGGPVSVLWLFFLYLSISGKDLSEGNWLLLIGVPCSFFALAVVALFRCRETGVGIGLFILLTVMSAGMTAFMRGGF